MDQISIPAEVVNGHLRHAPDLTMWEGQHVIATLTLAPKDAPGSQPANVRPEQRSDAELDPELPEWLDVERDVYVPMAVPGIRLEIKTLIVEHGKPLPFIPDE